MDCLRQLTFSFTLRSRDEVGENALRHKPQSVARLAGEKSFTRKKILADLLQEALWQAADSL